MTNDVVEFLLQEITLNIVLFKSTCSMGLSWQPGIIVSVTIPACRCNSCN
jgi:hypothetical protein